MKISRKIRRFKNKVINFKETVHPYSKRRIMHTFETAQDSINQASIKIARINTHEVGDGVFFTNIDDDIKVSKAMEAAVSNLQSLNEFTQIKFGITQYIWIGIARIALILTSVLCILIGLQSSGQVMQTTFEELRGIIIFLTGLGLIIPILKCTTKLRIAIETPSIQVSNPSVFQLIELRRLCNREITKIVFNTPKVIETLFETIEQTQGE